MNLSQSAGSVCVIIHNTGNTFTNVYTYYTLKTYIKFING